MNRVVALSRLIPDSARFLMVGSLGGPAQDVARLAGRDSPRAYPLGGAMGAAVPIALGLALAQPDERVIAVVGDGELMMSMGSLATVAVQAPRNLVIVCVDNGRYAETGAQTTHTAVATDLEQVAAGAGIGLTRTVVTGEDADEAAVLLRTADTTLFVRLIVTDEPAPTTGWELDGALLTARFRGGIA
jgi:thiamine pyrophosphate-dependent acetolactate synthase large subunit-like protein